MNESNGVVNHALMFLHRMSLTARLGRLVNQFGGVGVGIESKSHQPLIFGLITTADC